MTHTYNIIAPAAFCVPWCRDARGNAYYFDQLLDRIIAFHGHIAPGMLVGAKMVDVALAVLPGDTLLDAVTESGGCLPDAVQMLTPCTVGNGWLKVLDLGRFALALYDKHTGQGLRVYLDPYKVSVWPQIDTWFFKRVPKSEQDHGRILSEIQRAGRRILSTARVQIGDAVRVKRTVGQRGLCPRCGESYPLKHGGLCRACQGASPYTIAS